MRTHLLSVSLLATLMFSSGCTYAGPVPVTGPSLESIAAPVDPSPTEPAASLPASLTPEATATPDTAASLPSTTSKPPARQLHQIWNSMDVENRLNLPGGVAVDPQGNLYVMDSGNDRVQKFDSNGNPVDVLGKSGQGAGEFDCTLICMIATGPDGSLYVTDRDNARVQLFDSSGRFVTAWGSPGSKNGEFSRPFGIAVDGAGNVYVGDVGNHRVQVFDGAGNFLRSWGGEGSHPGMFSDDMADIAVDSAGNVYVTDRSNGAARFDNAGHFVGSLGACGDSLAGYPASGVAVDFQDNVYVFDLESSSICKYRADGTFMASWDGSGSAGGPFDKVGGLAVDRHGNLFVGELFLNRVREFGQPPQ